MLRWGVISKFEYLPRYQFLSDYLRDKMSLANELQFLDSPLNEFSECLLKWQRDFDQLRVGAPFGSLLAANMEQSNAMTMTLQSADCLQQINGKWWPRSLMSEALLRGILRKKLSIDLHSKAIVIGTGATAKASLHPLIKLGFQQIAFTDTDVAAGYDFIDKLKRRIFGVEFEFVEQQDISLLPGTFSVVVNTTPDTGSNSLIEDLSFFNYLRPQGVVIDLSVAPGELSFIGQAKLVQAQSLSGYEIAADVDALWLEMCFSLSLDRADYEQGLRDFLSTQKPD